MLEIAAYIDIVANQIFPSALDALKKCTAAEHVSAWRKQHCKELYVR
jgi:hypothetical protein